MSIICSCVVFNDDDHSKNDQDNNTDDADQLIKNLEFFLKKEAFPDFNNWWQ